MLALSISAFSQAPAYVPANGLKGYWPFDNNANDIGTNINNGAVYGATPTADRFNTANRAYNFNGTSDYILVPDHPSLSGYNNISISVWIRPDNTYGIRCIVAKWWQYLNCGAKTDNYAVALVNGEIEFATNFNNFGLSSKPAYTAPVNVWKHLVFVYNQTSASFLIYMDSNLIFSLPAAGPDICSSTNDLYFGADVDGQHYATPSVYRFFDGAIDDIGIWDRPLTPKEIKGLFLSTATGVQHTGAISNNVSVYLDALNTLVFVDPPAEAFYTEVINIPGEVVYSGTRNAAQAGINLNAEKSGLYFVKIITKDGAVIKKVVKE